MESSWVSHVLSGTNASRARKGDSRAIERTITKRDIIDCYIEQKGLSTFLKIPLDLTGTSSITSVSLDRIDNSKGYIKGNISLVTRFENMGRNNTGFDEFMEFCKNLRCLGNEINL